MSQVRKNVLDVSYHVSQYQTIIGELRSEIGRLKEKIVTEGNIHGNSQGSGAKKVAEELKELRDQMVVNFKDQMNLRLVLNIQLNILSIRYFYILYKTFSDHPTSNFIAQHLKFRIISLNVIN